MRRGLISASALLGVGAAVLAVYAALPAAGRGLAEARRHFREAATEDARLSAEFKRRVREDDVLNDLVVRAASGTLPLAEAADAAVVLLRVRDGFRHNCDLIWKVSTPRQGAARHLALRTQWLFVDPEAASVAAARIDAAFQTMDPGPGW